jgi:uncharacterized membrane protein YeaQ/YmgE (transglycosylase-associated protein family)
MCYISACVILEKNLNKENLHMSLESIIVMLVVGLIAGWLAGLIWKGGGFGLIWNLVLGVAGSFLGGWLFGFLGINIGGRWVGPIIAALAGALIILAIVNLVRKRR